MLWWATKSPKNNNQLDSVIGIKESYKKSIRNYLYIYYTECKEIFSGAGNGLIEASFEWMHTFARNKSSISWYFVHSDLQKSFFLPGCKCKNIVIFFQVKQLFYLLSMIYLRRKRMRNRFVGDFFCVLISLITFLDYSKLSSQMKCT